MVNINDVYLKVQDILNKNQNGILSPKEFNRLTNMASMNLFNRYYGSPKSYRPDKPISRINYAETQYISEALKPFLTTASVSSTEGGIIIPSDRLHIVDVEHSYTVSSVDKTASFRRVEFSRKNSWINSSIDAPTLEFPIYIENATNINVYPDTISTISVTYLRAPIESSWGYTLSGNRPVYDSGSSVDLEWEADEINNIVMEVVSLAAASLKDSEVLAYSESTKRNES